MIRAALSRPVSRRSVRFHFLANLAFGAVVAPVVVVVAGCNDQTPKLPRATLQSNLGPGDPGVSRCSIAPNDADWIVIGQPGAPVNTGSDYNGAPVEVECSVVPENGAFTVRARGSISKAGDTLSGSVYIVGTFSQAGPATVEATFLKSYGNFKQSDCQVTYVTNGQSVAAGRVRGTLSCPHLIDANQNLDCEGKAEFNFENCLQ